MNGGSVLIGEIPSTGGGLPVEVMIMGFVGGLALFLHGMNGVTAGLKGLAGGSLATVLSKLSVNRFAAVGTGILVTATIQSSTVTMVLVIGFLSAGMLTLVQSIGVIIGANVGTTITAQIIAFDIVGYALWMIGFGVLAEMVGRAEAVRMAGRALAGLGILFLGMGIMQGAMAPLREYDPFLSLMAADRGPIPGVLIGAGFTALVQSSSATIGVVVVMAAQGLVPLQTGVAIALGASLGTAVTTMLATIGRPRVALRAGLVHVLFNAVGVTVMLTLLGPLTDLAVSISPSAPELTGTDRLAAETPRQIANAYTLAKSGMLVMFLPFTRQLARLVERLVPEVPAERGLEPKYLDLDVVREPALALTLARKEILRMGRRVLAQLDRALPAILTGSSTQLQELADYDDEIDEFHDAIIDYLRRVGDRELSERRGEELFGLMTVTSALEIVGDIVDRDLARIALRRIEDGVPLSEESAALITEFHTTMRDLLADALQALSENDAELARSVLEAKPEVNVLLEKAAQHQVVRLGADAPERIAAFGRGTEMLEHLRRIYTFAKRIARVVID